MSAVNKYIIFHLFVETFYGFRFWFCMITWGVSVGLSSSSTSPLLLLSRLQLSRRNKSNPEELVGLNVGFLTATVKEMKVDRLQTKSPKICWRHIQDKKSQNRLLDSKKTSIWFLKERRAMDTMSHELQGLKRHLRLHLWGSTEVECPGKQQGHGSLDCPSDWYKSCCLARAADTVKGRAAGGDESRSCVC